MASINVVRSVIAAVGQPTASKIADVFGRVELVLVSIFFYILGTIVEAASNNIATFCAGAVLYQVCTAASSLHRRLTADPKVDWIHFRDPAG